MMKILRQIVPFCKRDQFCGMVCNYVWLFIWHVPEQKRHVVPYIDILLNNMVPDTDGLVWIYNCCMHTIYKEVYIMT